MSNWVTDKYKASELVSKIKNREIRVPPYQRGQVWSEKQEEKLIDSIKNGFPFGTLLLYKKSEEDYQLIDGLQRSTTIYHYLNSPAKFFNDSDISEEVIGKIFDSLGVAGNKAKIIEKLKEIIKEWVISNHPSMTAVNNMNVIACSVKIQQAYPTADIIQITTILNDLFIGFRNSCNEFSNIEIPAIVYRGDPVNLPEIFNRINSKGTTLSKYQILSATWSYKEYKIIDPKLQPIISYVSKFYDTLENSDFGVDGYTPGHMSNSLNVYQIIFGFGKLLSHNYPYLFGVSKKDSDTESCGFNLVNACLGNKNSKMADLLKIIEEVFPDDISFNKFLINILRVTDEVYKCLKPTLEFKLNKREESIVMMHTEMQICSMISNYFNARYSIFTYQDNGSVESRVILVDKSKDDYDTFKSNFKKNALKKYFIDHLTHLTYCNML